MLSINLLPALPGEAGASMIRHWREFVNQARPAIKSGEFGLFCPLGDPPTQIRGDSRITRVAKKYVQYPIQCMSLPEANATHILDHSYSHLIPWIGTKRTPVVVTLHDLVPLRDSRGLSTHQVRRFYQASLKIARADLVVCDSAASAEDALKLLKLSKEQVVVLPLGVDIKLFSEARVDFSLPESIKGSFRILSVGSTVPRKNLEIFPALFRALKPEIGSVSLVRVGAALAPSLRREIEGILGEGSVVELGGISDETLAAVYALCDVFLMPSTLEGFGLPVLEAMAAGCPVVCSNTSSLPEVAGNAARLFSPEDVKALSEILVELARNPELARQMQEAGRRHVENFTWGKYFDGMFEFYKSLG